MRRLYLRIYLAVLASLTVFALAAGLLWHSFADHGPAGRAQEVAAMLARNALPPADANRAEQAGGCTPGAAGRYGRCGCPTAGGSRRACRAKEGSRATGYS